MKRELYLKLTIDWPDYEDASDDLILEDVFENYKPKDGTNLELVKTSVKEPEIKKQVITREELFKKYKINIDFHVSVVDGWVEEDDINLAIIYQLTNNNKDFNQDFIYDAAWVLDLFDKDCDRFNWQKALLKTHNKEISDLYLTARKVIYLNCNQILDEINQDTKEPKVPKIKGFSHKNWYQWLQDNDKPGLNGHDTQEAIQEISRALNDVIDFINENHE